MLKIYFLIELLHSADAVATVDALMALPLDNCKFANVVSPSDEKVVPGSHLMLTSWGVCGRGYAIDEPGPSSATNQPNLRS